MQPHNYPSVLTSVRAGYVYLTAIPVPLSLLDRCRHISFFPTLWYTWHTHAFFIRPIIRAGHADRRHRELLPLSNVLFPSRL